MTEPLPPLLPRALPLTLWQPVPHSLREKEYTRNISLEHAQGKAFGATANLTVWNAPSGSKPRNRHCVSSNSQSASPPLQSPVCVAQPSTPKQQQLDNPVCRFVCECFVCVCVCVCVCVKERRREERRKDYVPGRPFSAADPHETVSFWYHHHFALPQALSKWQF